MVARLRELLAKLIANPRLVTAALLLAVLLAVYATTSLLPSVFEPLQAQTIDLLFRLRARFPSLSPADDGTVFLVPIDDESVQMRDEYYLGREDYARLIRNLRSAEVATQFLDVIFAAPESEQGDLALAGAIRDAEAYMGMAVGASLLEDTPDPGPLSPELERILARHRWHPQTRGDIGRVPRANRYFMTFPPIAEQAAGIGHLDLAPDRDGVIRRVPLLVRDRDGFLPSLHLRVVADFLGVEPGEIDFEPGRRLVLRGTRRPGSNESRDVSIPIDDQGRMIVNFAGPWGTLQTYPFTTVFEASGDRFMMEDLRDELRGRIAIISWFSTGRGDIGAVPTDPIYPRAGIWASAMNTILNGEFLRELSGWQMLLLVELPLLALLFVAAMRGSTIFFVASAAGLFLLYMAIVATAFVGANRILGVPGPILLLIGATTMIAAYQYHLASEARAKLHRELAVARSIQMRTLPEKMPEFAGYDLAGRSVPADQTGGDSFDVVPVAGDRLMLLLADATGHGIGPALSVTQVRAMLRVAIRLDAGLDAIVTQINDQLSDDLSSNRFVTAFLGVADRNRHEVTYHAAGQGPLLHFHAASGECEWFGSTGLALGMFSGLPLKDSKKLALAPGDIVGLMTDGVFEQENAAGEQFGEERVAELVRSLQHGPMSELMGAIFAAVETFRARQAQSDDVTVLLMRRIPEPPASC